jgi:hypothetical protein
MWTKEAPKEPGFYWLRYVSVSGLPEDATHTVVHLQRSGSDDSWAVSFPGNADSPPPDYATLQQYEWWPQPIRPPGGEIRPQQELVTEIARELYDRFVMGGWEPQDAHEQIAEWLSQARHPGGKEPGIFWRDGARWLLDNGTEYRLLDIAPNQEARWMLGEAEKQRRAGLRTIAKPGEPGYTADPKTVDNG